MLLCVLYVVTVIANSKRLLGDHREGTTFVGVNESKDLSPFFIGYCLLFMHRLRRVCVKLF